MKGEASGVLDCVLGCVRAMGEALVHMDDQEACYYLRQFISAMDYLHRHRHKVAHRCVCGGGGGGADCEPGSRQRIVSTARSAACLWCC